MKSSRKPTHMLSEEAIGLFRDNAVKIRRILRLAIERVSRSGLEKRVFVDHGTGAVCALGALHEASARVCLGLRAPRVKKDARVPKGWKEHFWSRLPDGDLVAGALARALIQAAIGLTHPRIRAHRALFCPDIPTYNDRRSTKKDDIEYALSDAGLVLEAIIKVRDLAIPVLKNERRGVWGDGEYTADQAAGAVAGALNMRGYYADAGLTQPPAYCGK